MTPQERKVFELALEAFKEINYDQAYSTEITAIKEALAQPEQEPVDNYCRECLTYNGHQEGCSQYVATQNEKQKPVAWRLYKDGELYALKYEKEDRGLYYTWEPLYTTPPQRTWVGLTDEQKLSLEIQGGKADVMLAELVEQWLKEKNT